MRITPVSFCGKREIQGFAEQYGPLTTEEKRVQNLANRVHDIEVDRTSDGDFCTERDAQMTREYVEALKVFTIKPSAFAYHTAIDTLSAPGFDAMGYLKSSVANTAKQIAEVTPEITKTDILNDWNKLNRH